MADRPIKPPNRTLFEVTITHHWRDWARSAWCGTARVVARTPRVAEAFVRERFSGLYDDYTVTVTPLWPTQRKLGVVSFTLNGGLEDTDTLLLDLPGVSAAPLQSGHCIICGAPLPPRHSKYCREHTGDLGRCNKASGKQPGPKLTARQAGEIKWLLAEGCPWQQITARYGISYTAVRQIRIGKSWRDVAPVPVAEVQAVAGD